MRLNLFRALLYLLLFISNSSFANREVHGPTYPIIETNFLEFIYERLQKFEDEGKFGAMHEELKNKAKEKIYRPTAR